MHRTTTSVADRSEQGAALVEFSLVLPLLLLIVFGILELGYAFRTHITVGAAANEGARVASFKGDDLDADCVALEAVIAELGSEVHNVTFIQIHKVDANGDPDPLERNTYSYDGVGDITDCAEWVGPVLWDPATRQTKVGSQPLDVLGIRVVSAHTWLTQIPPFRGTATVDETTIVRVEPEAYE